MAMLRGTLITSVFRKATTLAAAAATSARTVTLMSADCERITRGLLVLHDMWADVTQVAVATYLIQTQLGVACVAPIAVTLRMFVCRDLPWHLRLVIFLRVKRVLN